MRLLIVDADPVHSEKLVTGLKDKKALVRSVDVAQTAESAYIAVATAVNPFNVFLVDHELGPGETGIEVMQQLLAQNPIPANAIFFTSSDSVKRMRAYQLGAYRYLKKPFEFDELIWHIRTLRKRQQTMRELEWLGILSNIAIQTQRAVSLNEVADILTHESVKLGFQRARLWLLDDEGNTFYGASYTGEISPAFKAQRLSVADSPYMQRVFATKRVTVFKGAELGPSYLEQQLDMHGFSLSTTEWVVIPLWYDDRCLGILALDNLDNDLPFRLQEQVQFMTMLGQHVATALERVGLLDKEKKENQALVLLNEINSEINAQAYQHDVSRLLHVVRSQIGRLIDVSNFMVILVEEDTDEPEIALYFEAGVEQETPERFNPDGLRGYLLKSRQPIYLPQGTAAYRAERNIPLIGAEAQSWMGTPLSVEGQTIGAIVMEDNRQPEAYSRDAWHILCSVANQVAGIIQLARVKEYQNQAATQLAILHQTSEVIMRLAEENENWLWHTTLTVATAEYALGFNRAIVLWADAGTGTLNGRMGIGHFDEAEARADWRLDKKQQMNYTRYLRKLRSGKIAPTPIERMIKRFSLKIDAYESTVFGQVIREHKRRIVRREDVQAQLPQKFVDHFGETAYAVLPLKGSQHVTGVVIVDNIHNQKVIRDTTLDNLETLLAQAVLTVQNLHERRLRGELIDLYNQVFAENQSTRLDRMLTRIALSAKSLNNADYVIIHPLLSDNLPFEYDDNGICSIDQHGDAFSVPPPRSDGLTHHILQTGVVRIPNIAQHDYVYGGEALTENEYMRRQSIQALIGVPIKEPYTDKRLGVFYLKYCNKRPFTPQDVARAKLFARLAGVAILSHRSTQAADSRLLSAKGQELYSLTDLLKRVLNADIVKEAIIQALLYQVHHFIEKPDVIVNLTMREWLPTNKHDAQEGRRRYTMDKQYNIQEVIETDLYQGAVGSVFKSGEPQLTFDDWGTPWDVRRAQQDRAYPISSSQLLAPIISDREVIGVLDVTSPHLGAFNKEDVGVFKRLAHIFGLALNNIDQQGLLQNLLTSARVVTAPTGVKETLAAIVPEVRKVTPDLSILSVWYKLPEKDEVKLGILDGVKNRKALKAQRNYEETVPLITYVLDSREPIWVPNVVNDPQFNTYFAEQEGIKSTAAFPLHSEQKVEGVLFLNYRQKHEFSEIEKKLLSVLAEVLAASLRNSLHLAMIQHQRKRLYTAMHIAEAVGTTFDLNEATHKVLERVHELLPTMKLVILAYNEAERKLEFVPASFDYYPMDKTDYHRVRHLAIDGPSLVCAAARESLRSGNVTPLLNVRDVGKDKRYLNIMSSTKSQLCVSMMRNETLLGVFALESEQYDAFHDQETVDLITSIAHQIGVMIDRTNQSRKLRFSTHVASTTAWATEIAHDANRQLGYIRNRAYWLKTKPLSLETTHQWAREIDFSADRLAGAIETANNLGSTGIEAFPIDKRIEKWVCNAVRKRGKDVEMVFHMGCNGLMVQTSEYALMRIVNHLVQNAMDAMFATEQEPNQAQLIVQTSALPAYVEVRVQDNGPGIDPHVRHTLFEEPKSTKGKEKETRGYGLLFARLLVENMGGRIWVDTSGEDIDGISQDDGDKMLGAVFCFSLPLTVDETLGEYYEQ